MGLTDDPFSLIRSKDGSLRISRGGRFVVVVGAEEARKLLARLEGASSDNEQHLLARATGNYRRGNERQKRSGG